jgi:type II secretory pathway pseudopilin PulG
MTLIKDQGSKIKDNLTGGFTVIELIVVSAIFVTITSVVMVRFSLFNNRILTTNLIYDIALSIREAQTFGLNVRGFDSGSGVVFDTGYGVHFDISSNSSYIFFADINKNKKFEPIEAIDILSLGGGHTINRLCGNVSCSDTGAINSLDVVFVRPDPDANISTDASTGYQTGSIRIVSPQGVEREVKIFLTGQIAIVTNPS